VFGELPALLRRHEPDLVLFFGLASRTPYLRIEQRAVNRATAIYADVAKQKYPTRALISGAAPELRVRADAMRLLAAARTAGVDVRLSRDAGRYICNAAFYVTLAESARANGPGLVAFVHVPRPRCRLRAGGERGARRPTMEALVRAGAAILGSLAAQARRG
jgi:pyroglutamyl-peptidase